jgi:predicted O-methyltransferase YrrM
VINKIINNLKKPHLIPGKIINAIRFNKFKKRYKIKTYDNDQNIKFDQLKLDREKGIFKLNQLKEQNPVLNRAMSSEHETLFSAISLLKKNEELNILEIGTHDGVNSYLLSLLFENSKIKTIDLKNEDHEFQNSYNRKKNFLNFITERNKIIKKKKNIFFKEENSLNLISAKEKYDLIWVDGSHGYPTACIDIINSLKLINNNGLILCDDVYVEEPKIQDKTYRSIATYETISALEKEKLINYHLIYKRLDPLHNCDPKKRKFIAILNKNFI